MSIKVNLYDANEIETEAHNAGWLAGYDALVDELHQGFGGDMPEWLVSLVGGKRVVTSALKRKADELDIILEPDYDAGFQDGYDELLADIIDGYQQKGAEIPDFLHEIVDDEPSDVNERAKK